MADIADGKVDVIVVYKGDIYSCEHEAIIDEQVFEQTREFLADGRAESGTLRNRHEFLLRSLVRCRVCGSTMSASWTTKRGQTYRYYVCNKVTKNGKGACSVRSVPATGQSQLSRGRLRMQSK